MLKSFNCILDNVKGEYKQAKRKRLINRRKKKWFMFKFLAKARVFSYENNFGNHEGIDQRSDIVEIRVMQVVQQEHLVRRKGAKEKPQIERDPDKLLKLMDGLLL